MQYTFPCSFSSTVRSWNRLAPVPNLGQLPALLKSRFRYTRKRVILFATPLALPCGWLAGLCLGPCLRPTGGARRDRTADRLLAKQVLSHLSYGPRADTPFRGITLPRHHRAMYVTDPPCLSATSFLVGLGGLEPPTSPLSGVRSNRLSYRPEVTDPPGRGSAASLRTVSGPNGIKQFVWVHTPESLLFR